MAIGGAPGMQLPMGGAGAGSGPVSAFPGDGSMPSPLPMVPHKKGGKKGHKKGHRKGTRGHKGNRRR